AQPIRALAFSKFSFDRISFGSSLTLHPFLGYVNLFILGWSVKFRTTHASSAFLAVFTFFTCPIDSIDQSRLRLIHSSLSILFYRVPPPGAFAVGIRRQQSEKRISTYDADR